MTAILALVRKECFTLFGSPIAYVTLLGVATVTAVIFFDYLHLYNQTLFIFASTTIGGMNADEIPDYINLWDSVFFPVMEALGVAFIGAVPLVTMRVFAEERAHGTDELLLTTHLTPTQIVIAKFGVTFAFIALMMVVSFIYPATAISRGGLGLQHLTAVFIGLTLLGFAIASIGLACSAFTSSQLIASVSAWAISFAIWDFGWMHPFLNQSVAGALDLVSIHQRYGSFAEGIVALSNIVYFVALALIAVAVSRFSFDLRRIGL